MWKKYYSEPSWDVKFEQPPASNSSNEFWSLKFDNRSIPIPKADYVFIDVNDTGFWLREQMDKPDSVAVGVGCQKGANEPINDVFARAAPHGEQPRTTPGGVEATTEMFGGAISLHEIMQHAYSHSSDDLTCSSESMDYDLSLIYSFILKDVAMPWKAYNGLGYQAGFVTITHMYTHAEWVSAGNGLDLCSSDVTSTDQLLLQEFAVQISNEPAGTQSNPEWIHMLSRVLQSREKKGQAALRTELERAGFTTVNFDVFNDE